MTDFDPRGIDAVRDGLIAERDLARSIAVSLEQENAHLLDQIRQLRGMVNAALACAVEFSRLAEPDDGDVVGVEDMPCGDPWAELRDENEG